MRTVSKVLTLVLAAAVLSLVAPTPTHAVNAGLPAKLDPDILSATASGRAIVGFTHDVGAATIQRLSDVGIQKAVRLDTIDAVGVAGTLSSYKRIARWDDVAYVDADTRLQMENYSAKKDTKVYEVRKGQKPLHSKYNGKGAGVAVIDTGIWSPHPDLTDQVKAHFNFEPAWIFDMINDGVYSDQLVEATGNPVDSYGHGTHVAGIVGGTGEAGGKKPDMSGVAPGARILDFKIADVTQGVDCSVPCDFGWEINALVAYEYVIEHRKQLGIDIVTNSWSIFEVDSGAEPITLIVKAAAERGLINLFAASNDGCEKGKNSVAPGPNRLPSVLTIAAAEKSDGAGLGHIADFSSCGPQVDVAAPGVDVYSTMAPSALAPIGGHTPPGPGSNAAYYTAFSGTSMATPHVAGIVALMLDANPSLSFKQIHSILANTATDYGDPGFDNSWGFGEVNAFKATIKAENLR